MCPTLSIVIPHYNHNGKLPCLLDSILAQQFKELEVILVDDCSTVPCDTIVDAYKAKGLDIVLLTHNERIYTMKARLAGIRAARGEIIGFADADDVLWGTDALRQNIQLFLQEKPDILHFRTALIDERGAFSSYALLADPFAPRLEGKNIFCNYLESQSFWAVSSLWNKLFTKDVLMRSYDRASTSSVLRHVEDGYLLILAMFHAQIYIGSPDVGYGYYYEDRQATESAERAIYYYHTIQELTHYLDANQCPHKLIVLCRHVLQQQLCHRAGQMCIALGKQDGLSISDETYAELLRWTDKDTLLNVLLLANRLNAEKIIGCFKAILPKANLMKVKTS